MTEYTWDLKYFEYELMIPKDYTYLYNILLKNPDKKLSSTIIKKHVVLIIGLYPNEVVSIYNSIIDIFTKKNLKFSEDEYKYEYLAQCFLKYGVDGIKPVIYKKCSQCKLENSIDNLKKSEYARDPNLSDGDGESYDDLNNKCIIINNSHKFHSLISSGVVCIYCGKKANGTVFGSNTIGSCLSICQNHNWYKIRKLICPYDINI